MRLQPPKRRTRRKTRREKERKAEKKRKRRESRHTAAKKIKTLSLTLQTLSARVTQHVPSSFSRAHERKRRPGEEEELQTHVPSHEAVEKSHAFLKAMKRGRGAANGDGENDEDEEAFPRGNFVDEEEGEDEEENERSRRASRTKTATTATERFAAIYKGSSSSLKGKKAGGKGGGGKYIEALKWKTLRRGVKLLGIVSHVSNKGLIISLQNGLKGTVSRSEASDAFYIQDKNRVKRRSKNKPSSSDDEFSSSSSSGSSSDESSEEEEEDGSKKAKIGLESLFKVGQIVRSAVLNLDEGKTGGKRIELTLRLSQVCAGLDKGCLTEGAAIPAVVTSVEDHGYIVEFGIDDSAGFLPRDSVDGEHDSLLIGQLIEVVITSTPTAKKDNNHDNKKRKKNESGSKLGGGNVYKVCAEAKRCSSAIALENKSTSISTILPGMLVKARVKSVLEDGISVSFMTYFSGTIDCFHIAAEDTGSFKEGQKLRSRVIFVDAQNKRVGLSLQPHLLEAHSSASILPSTGSIFENAVINRVDPNVGVSLQISQGGKKRSVTGYAHVSHLSDDHVEKVEKKYKVGKQVKVRVIGHRLLDAVANVSLKKSVLEQPFFSLEELVPGMIVKGEVLATEHFGAIVKLAEGVKALCPPIHVSDIVGRTTSSKVAPGAILKFRVINVDRSRHRAIVTHKRALIKSELPVLKTIEDAIPGRTTHGIISGVVDYGVFVTLYGNLKGLAGSQDLGLVEGQSIADAYAVGQVVRVTIVSADRGENKLRLSLSGDGNEDDDAAGTATGASISLSTDAVPIGRIVASATITKIVQGSSIIEVTSSTEEGSFQGLIAFQHLSDNPVTALSMASTLNVGEVLTDTFVVIERKPKRVIMSRKLSIIEAVRSSSLPERADKVKAGKIYPGYVASTSSTGVFVRFLGSLTGLAPPSQIPDGCSATDSFFVGQTVQAMVLSVDVECTPPRLSLSLRLQTTAQPLSDAPLIRSFFSDLEFLDYKVAQNPKEAETLLSDKTARMFEPGCDIEGSINETKDYGVLIDIDEDENAVGLVSPHQVPESVEMEDLTPETRLSGKVLDVSRREGVIDIGKVSVVTKKDLSKKKKKAKTTSALLKKLKVGEKTEAIVELIKAQYVILSLPKYSDIIGYAPVHYCNVRLNDASERFEVNQRVNVVIAQVPSSSSDDVKGGEFYSNRLLLTVPFVDSNKANHGPEVGTKFQGVVSELQPLQALVSLPNSKKGRIHITETGVLAKSKFPLEELSLGSTVNVAVLGMAGDRGGLLDLTLMSTVDEDEDDENVNKNAKNGEDNFDEKLSLKRPTLQTLEAGQSIHAYVISVLPDGVKVSIRPEITAFVPLIETASSLKELKRPLEKRFSKGEKIKATIVNVNVSKKHVDLSFRDQRSISVGEKLFGIVSRFNKGTSMMVRLGAHVTGRVFLTDVSDEFKENPFSDTKVGDVVEVRVISVKSSGEIDLSMRPSLLSKSEEKKRRVENPEINDAKSLEVGKEVSGYVKSVSKVGCFVALSRNVDALIKLTNLADGFVEKPAVEFPTGRLVRGRILSADAKTNRVEMSLRTSQSDSKMPNKEAVASLKVGDAVMGTVRSVQSYGVFVTLDETGVSGLCHISMFADVHVKDDLANHIRAGERVRAKIMKVDYETGKVSLGIKASVFADDDDNDDSGAQRDGDSDDEDEMQEDLLLSDDDDDDDDGDNDDKKNAGKMDLDEPDEEVEHSSDSEEGGVEDSESDDEEEDDDDEDDEDDEDDDEDEDDNNKTSEKEEDVGFAWEEEENEQKQKLNAMKRGRDESTHLDDGENAGKLSKRAKRRKAREAELEILRQEQQLRDEGRLPESASEYEKLILASPLSSFLWIQYVAFQVSVGAYEDARAVAERALEAIPAQEEDERMNIWIAYLNLENSHGLPNPKEAVSRLFKRAVNLADPKKLYLVLVDMYTRTEQTEALEETLKLIVKKFRSSCKVWLTYIRHVTLKGDAEGSRKLLDRATTSLPKRKHIKLLVKVALLEMKEGDPERGRTMFEGILRNYPKRTDIWSVYIDQEIKQNIPERIRALFERATHLELNARSMKFLFKRYLEYERSHGNTERMTYVKARAMEYVERTLNNNNDE